MLMHDGFNRVNTGLNGSGLSSRNNGYGCKRLVQSVPTSLVNGQVTPEIFARPYTVIGSGTILETFVLHLHRRGLLVWLTGRIATFV